jgi:hypothetical protein
LIKIEAAVIRQTRSFEKPSCQSSLRDGFFSSAMNKKMQDPSRMEAILQTQSSPKPSIY